MVNIGNLTAVELWVGPVKADFAFVGDKQVWGGGGSSVHYIDYINTNVAEMVTDYTPNSNTWVEGRFRGKALGNIFVGTTDTKWRFFSAGDGDNTFYVDVNGMSNRISQSGWDTTKWYDISAGNCFFTCVPDSGTTLSQTGSAVSTTYSTPLVLGSSTYSWGGQYEEFDCAGFKVWEGNTLMKDYRPAKDANGVVCMYEEVSGTYCYPTNTGGVFLGYETIKTKVRYTAASGLPAWEGDIVGQIVGSSGQATTQIPNISSAISIELGQNVTGIGDYAFYNCSNLSSIAMTDGIRSIGSQAFDTCTGLNEITLSNGLSSIAATSFDNCSNLSIVNWMSKNASNVYNMADYPWGLANGTTIHCSNADLIVGQSPATEATLCFTAQEANSTVRLDKVGSPNAISLQTSTDGYAWTDYSWSGSTGSTLTLANVGDKVYMRAKNGNTTISSSANDHYKFVMTGTLSASGNVDTLLDKSGAITLTNFCYSKLFMGCTSLTTAPALPSTTLAQSCYGSMFRGCTSLTTAPALPATTVASQCYREMFQNCSNLNTITLGYTGNFADAPTNTFYNWVDGVAASGTFYYFGSDTTTGTSAIPTGWTVISQRYGGLTITAREANSTVSMIKDSGAPSVTLEYSTDGVNWNPFVVGTTTVTLNNVGDYVCFRAGPNGNTTFTTQYTIAANRFVITGSVDLSGNLNSIINQDYDNVTTINANGYGGIGYLFDNCSAIVDASKLLMKATTIGDFTYNRTFYGCSNMTKAPTIFATSIGSRYSFGDLFNGCSSLSEIKIYYTGNFGGEKTSNWVSGVPATGTFYYNGSDTTRGASYIPTGWTITPFTP